MTVMGPLPEPEIIIRKAKGRKPAAHHGGAWKVAYADFVTAMMAFFLLMWLLSSTNDNTRRGLADYFSPTIIKHSASGGANGIMGGRSPQVPVGAAPHSRSSGVVQKPMTDAEQLKALEEEIRRRMAEDAALNALQGHIRLTHTPEGLRIELIDQADYSMFTSGTATLDPRAQKLLGVVAQSIDDLPNALAIRGHTDAQPFSSGRGKNNNWNLSAQRAESTRQTLQDAGIAESRFARLEGVAHTQPYDAKNIFDPRNRRLSVTLLRE